MNPHPEHGDTGFSRAVSRNSSHHDSKTSLAQLPALPVPSPSIHEDPTQESGSVDPTPPDAGPAGSARVSSEIDEEQAHMNSFVEFDLSHRAHMDSQASFSRDSPSREVPREPSFRESGLAGNETKENLETLQAMPVQEDFFSSEGSGWNSMKKVTQENYYDEMGNLEFSRDRNFGAMDDKSRQGYTKIDTEEQLNKYALLDEKTDFLFQDHTGSKPSEAADSDEEEFDDNTENLDSDEALAGTRGMLTDSQKFAYIGIIKLLMVDMATDLALLNQKTANKVAKKLAASQKNFANWTLYIMSKFIDHLDVSKEEQAMIENLSMHGVQAGDLVQSLLSTDLNNHALEKKIPGFDLRWVLVCDLFLILVTDGYFDSRSRTLLMRFAAEFGVPSLELRQFERRLIESLDMDTSNKTIENKDDKLKDRSFIEKHIQKNKTKRLTYVGLATIGGTLAIGLSAGLLAPVIGAGLAAGLTTVGISGTGGFLAGVGGSVAITTGGAAIGAKVGNKAGARRMGEVNTFEMKPLHNNKRSNLIVTVSGWMNGEMDDVRLPFSTVDPVMGDMFSLLWEPEMLKSMGQTIGILASEALSTSIQQILGATVLTALMSAIQLPMMLSKLSYLVDNPWNVSLDRAWKAGKILADTLISGNMGVRPITLVGFSLGSRLIYSCLIEMANRGGFGLIENVIILGSPVAVKYDQITLARSVVSGKFINGYTSNDWILGYLFRATGGGLSSVGGISPIENIPGVENFDCTKFVEGHMSYRKAIPKILKALDWEIFSEEFAEIEEPDLEQRERQRKLISEFDEARAKMEAEQLEQKTKQKSWKDWFRPKQKNWWDVYDESPKEKENEAEEFEEYNVDDRDVFNVDALMHEVQDIELIANHTTPEGLQEIRKDVEETVPTRPLNEDLEK